ncbi:LysM peptidoglycan-binding domain-containing protein [Muribaculum sp.]|uniref:LysM peptidoglycan-binding domain-containing protein n=1 Tax=Muribaculum sp. TaxID=1918611 RepID=UPI0023BC7D51|nr:LysM peptidoglycan-binding domain-containing protein [Muribaculum sp.]MDE5704979.1 LysM peptidoglycan-binding domain-containing protein [Muribaculum sp.]
MKKVISSLIIACAAITASAAPSILSLKHSISDNSITYPESFETDTHKMLQNWYLQNYTVLDTNFDKSQPLNATDEVYIKRLSALPTTIEMPYNQIVRSYINMYTQRKRELVEAMLGMSLYYMPIFEQALERHGVPLELRYLPVIESALNPDAVSRAGATGLWQFMLPTARGLGMEISTLVDERRDPHVSSEAAAVYLKQLYNMYDDWSLAIAAYNCGPGNVNKALRRAGIEDKKDKDFWSIYYFLPQETRGYVPAFIAANYVMTYYNLHGISPALAKRPIITDSVHVSKRVNFNQISQVLNIPVEEIRVLNPQYRHDIIPGDIKPYSLVLPSMQVYSYIMSEDSIAGRDATLYARRSVVEPTSLEELENNSEFSTKLVVKTHKVKRGETLSGIAKKYGVSVSDIKKWNGLRKNSVPRGRNLKINTYERVRVEKPASETAPETNTSDCIAEASSDAEKTVTETVAAVASDTAKKAKKSAATATPTRQKKQSASSSTKTSTKSKGGFTNHKVKKGESLYRIAKAKGTTVEAIQKANGMSGSAIREGQTLKIPR